MPGALDGKTLRRALNKGEDARVIVNAWATESGLLLGQRSIKGKLLRAAIGLDYLKLILKT